MLLQIRASLHTMGAGHALGALVLAFVALSVGIYLGFQLMGQLRFLFGRGRPQGLAPQLGPEEQGSSPAAEHYVKEALRQQALDYAEPADPLSGLLYAVMPKLIYAPPPLRGFAERQFQAGLLTISLMLGLGAAIVLGPGGGDGAGGSVSGWIALIFFLIAIPSLWRPQAGAGAAGGINLLSVPQMAGLIGFSVLGPVLLSLAGTHLPRCPIEITPGWLFLLLALALVLHGLFFAAVARNALPAPSTAVSGLQESWNISTNPALISGEAMRALQEVWRDQIPNRRYTRIDPVVQLHQRSGNFRGSLVEETQPVPFLTDAPSQQPGHMSADPVLLLAINAYALAMTLWAAAASFAVVSALSQPDLFTASGWPYTLFYWALALAGFDAARRLALRFDFRSQLVWLEMEGSFQSAQVALGNQFHANLQASSQVVQVEAMTFRLWAADVHSIAFGKDGRRYIYAMMGIPDYAAGLAARLRGFAANQAAVVSLGNSGDVERMSRIHQLNAQMATPPAPGGQIDHGGQFPLPGGPFPPAR